MNYRIIHHLVRIGLNKDIKEFQISKINPYKLQDHSSLKKILAMTLTVVMDSHQEGKKTMQYIFIF